MQQRLPAASHLNDETLTLDVRADKGIALKKKVTHPNSEVAFALPHSLLVRLPLVRSAGLGHVGGLLPPQALTKLVHLRGHVLPGTGERERRLVLVSHWL